MTIENAVVDGIRMSLASDDREALIERYIEEGCTLDEITSAFIGSQWRFHIHSSGTKVAVVPIDALYAEHDDAFISFQETSKRLVVMDMDAPDLASRIEQTWIRTEVARAALRLELVDMRINRFYDQTNSTTRLMIQSAIISQHWVSSGMEAIA